MTRTRPFLAFSGAIAIGVVTVGWLWLQSIPPPELQGEDHNHSRGRAKGKLLCGPQSLFWASFSLGRLLNLDTIVSSCRVTEKGCTMLELKRVAERFGLSASGVRIGWRQLRLLDCPAILLVNGQHYLVVDPQPDFGDSVLVYDPDNSDPTWLGQAAIERMWNGEALVIRSFEKKQPPRSGPQIQLDTLVRNIGNVSNEKKLEVMFPFRNVGSEILVINKIHGCARSFSAVTTKRRILPNESASIKLTLNLNDRANRGYFADKALVHTNDPTAPNVPLVIIANVSYEQMAFPTELSLGSIARGLSVARTVELVPPDVRQSFSIKSMQVEGSLNEAGISAKVAWRSQKKRSSHEVGHAADASEFLVTVLFNVDSSARWGDFSGRLTIETTAEGKSLLEVPITGTVVDDLRAIPSTIEFAIDEQHANRSESVVLESVTDRSLTDIRNCETGGLPVTLREKASPGSSYRILEVSLDSSTAAQRTNSGYVTCHLMDGRKVRIPVVLKGSAE